MTKPLQLTLVLALLVLAVVGISLLGRPEAGSDACGAANGPLHTIVITNGHPSSGTVQGNLCDRLTFVNDDHLTREIAFGPHEDHVSYDGIAERFLNYGQSFTITLNETGTYHWHDHLHDDVEGYFTVSR
ncbi:MAG TPA: hypothetical protein VFH39_01885 [Candidatus Saccharimonadales bacterium]|nr:hypothetical protein [Candidatus Saccharimonadales bacterium]